MIDVLRSEDLLTASCQTHASMKCASLGSMLPIRAAGHRDDSANKKPAGAGLTYFSVDFLLHYAAITALLHSASNSFLRSLKRLR